MEGTLTTMGDWNKMQGGCNNWIDVGNIVQFRFGGSSDHSDEFVHTYCNDYWIDEPSYYTVTSKWLVNNFPDA